MLKWRTIRINKLNVNTGPCSQFNFALNGATWVGTDSEPLQELYQRVCIAACFDSQERQNAPRCHKKTRVTICGSLTGWRRDPSSQDLVRWITGWAGVGKSAIAQTIAYECSMDAQLAASFFFYCASQDRNSLKAFVATIAFQLSVRVPGAREFIISLLLRDKTIFEKSFQGQWQALVVDVLLYLHRQGVSQPMLIIVDGIDECISEEEQRTLLSTLLSSSRELCPSFKFLVSSRPENHLRTMFEEFFEEVEVKNRNTIELTEEDGGDIELFLQSSLQAIHDDYDQYGERALQTQSWPGEDKINQLVKRASGQFIYASVVVDFVRNYNGNPNVPLEEVLKPHSNSLKELDHLYTIVMGKILKSTPKKHRRLLHHLMVCILLDVVYTYRPDLPFFCPKELNTEVVKTLLRNLYPVVDLSGIFRHRTFCQFLIRPSVPHPFSITSRHISVVTSYALQSLSTKRCSGRVKALSLMCLLHSTPTPELIFRLTKLPRDTFDTDVPFVASTQQHLWRNTGISKCLLSWITVDVSAHDLRV
ncbi:hypothetical protein BDN72DRAFT_84911 [Pluteus cervinus]|uniref:Uncharacterized protein n=1 Tax=Pluteus cervinus TaxID=181527 RepID=A0ACD3APP4_9AGAR|nr:hypothetical protein BDN72DRAFT_84911 [Pluteus cervinus]